MKSKWLVPALSLAALVAAALVAVAAADRDSVLTSEISRLETKLESVEGELPKEVQPETVGARDLIARVRRAKGFDYRLYRLRDAFVSVETLAYVASHKDAAKSLDAFDALWNRERPAFGAGTPRAAGSVLERALIESASTRAERLFAASRPYAKASAPLYGVYYLAQASANLAFRDFVVKNGTLAAAAEASSTPARLAQSVDDVEQSMLEFFKGDVTSPQAVPVSVRVKEARELLAAGRVDGAALLAIEARLTLSRRGGPKGNYPAAAERQGSMSSLLASWAADEEPPMNETIRKEVVPFWSSMLLPAVARAPMKTPVTVTLVRWPYT